MAQDDGLNTAGFSRQFEEWRYFNSALERLGGYRPAMVNVNVPRELNVKKELDWGRVLGESFKLAMGGLQARQEYVNKEVDSWLRSHSLEEYKQAVITNSLPFQDDPLAMNRLKYDHGKIAFQLAERDFQNRVDRNEFVGMAPEQVDAEHFKHVRNVLKELNGTFPWATESDYWFKKGFYEDSEGGRIKTLIAQQKVANDWNVQEGIMQDAALVTAVAEDKNSTADQVLATLKEVTENPKFVHYSPKQKADLLKNCIEGISNRPDGHYIMDAMADYEVFDGVTLKDSIGYVDWEKAQIKSRNTAMKMDADTYGQFYLDLEDRIAKGDYQGIQRDYETELAYNGNRMTDKAEMLLKAIPQAKAQAEKLVLKAQSDAANDMKDLVKGYMCINYLESLRSGRNTEPNSVFDLQGGDIDRVFWVKMNAGEYTLDDAIAIAKNPTGNHNPARSYFRRIGSGVLSTMRNQAEDLMNNKGAVIEKPALLDQVTTAIASDPSAVDIIFGDLPAWDKENLVTLVNAISTGLTYQDAIKSMSKHLVLSKTPEGRKEIQRIDERYSRELKKMEGDGEVSGDYYSQSYIKTKAEAYHYVGLTITDSLEKARAEFNNNHFRVRGAPVPKSFFNVNNSNPEDAYDYFDEQLDKYRKENGKNSKWVYSYNPNLRSFDITDLNTMHLVKRWTFDDFAKEYTAYIDKQASETPTTFIHDIYNFFTGGNK